jgi:hypothetical protein
VVEGLASIFTLPLLQDRIVGCGLGVLFQHPARVLIQSDGNIVAAGITTGITTPTYNTVNKLTLSRYLAE